VLLGTHRDHASADLCCDHHRPDRREHCGELHGDAADLAACHMGLDGHQRLDRD
jgi:hypothetical protein